MESIINALQLDTESAEWLAAHPDNLTWFDVAGRSDKREGHTGWVAWFDASDSAVSVTNGNAIVHEGVRSMDEAVAAAKAAAQ